METVRIGIVTVSDRASRGEYEDKGGPAIRAWFERILTTPWEAVPRVVADEQARIGHVHVRWHLKVVRRRLVLVNTASHVEGGTMAGAQKTALPVVGQ